MAMLPINTSSIRTSPLRPEMPGPERPVARPIRPIGELPRGPGVRLARPAAFRVGGRVKRTGWAKVHKGEKVVTAAASAMGAGKKNTRARRARKKGS